MNDIKIFESNEFGKIRLIEKDGQPYFVAKDLCEILGTETKDIKKILEDDEVDSIHMTDTIGRQQLTLIVNESGLYNLILKSRKDNTKKFRKWVTSEVLPSIRKNGGYIANQEDLDPEEIIAKALVVAQKIIENQKNKLVEMQPKAEFYDQVAGSSDAIDIGTVAKVLNVRNIGRNKLFEILRNKEILMNNNQPYQKYIDLGYFRIVESKWTTPEGETHIGIKTLVYQKGLDFIRKILKSEQEGN